MWGEYHAVHTSEEYCSLWTTFEGDTATSCIFYQHITDTVLTIDKITLPAEESSSGSHLENLSYDIITRRILKYPLCIHANLVNFLSSFAGHIIQLFRVAMTEPTLATEFRSKGRICRVEHKEMSICSLSEYSVHVKSENLFEQNQMSSPSDVGVLNAKTLLPCCSITGEVINQPTCMHTYTTVKNCLVLP